MNTDDRNQHQLSHNSQYWDAQKDFLTGCQIDIQTGTSDVFQKPCEKPIIEMKKTLQESNRVLKKSKTLSAVGIDFTEVCRLSAGILKNWRSCWEDFLTCRLVFKILNRPCENLLKKFFCLRPKKIFSGLRPKNL